MWPRRSAVAARDISTIAKAASAICDAWSFGGCRLSVAGRHVCLYTEQPGLQPVEIDIDDGRRIEGEDLRQGEAADDGVAERLANFRADPGTHPHRHATAQSRPRCHQDRPE